MAIGLFGGSFNPAHDGHRHVSLEMMRRLRLDRVWWLLSPGNPLKDHSELGSLGNRIAHARAVSDHPEIEVTGFEASLPSPFTADTIRERGYRTVSDALSDLPGIYIWKSPEGRDLAAVRGTISADNNKILVLVDGMPWYDGIYTHGFIDDFLVASLGAWARPMLPTGKLVDDYLARCNSRPALKASFGKDSPR